MPLCSLLLAMAAGSAASTTTTHAAAELTTHIVEAFYDIGRGNLREIQIPTEPGEPGSHPAAGLTQAELSVDRQLQPLADGCVAASLSITLRITITMPRWSGTGQRRPGHLDAVMAHLQAHEDVHRDDAMAAGAQLQQDLSQLPTTLSCAGLEQLISQRLQQQMLQLRVRGEIFDQLTDYGRKGMPSAAPQRRTPRVPTRPSTPLF